MPDYRVPIKIIPANQTNDQLVRSGLLFLLKEKDRYGVWYSTQATINVLDAMLGCCKRPLRAPGYRRRRIRKML